MIWTKIARRWRRILGVLAEDINCTPGLAALGLKQMNDKKAKNKYIKNIRYLNNIGVAADIGSWYLSRSGVWAVKSKSGSDFMGTCGFWQGKGWPRELTWRLLPEFCGQGFAY